MKYYYQNEKHKIKKQISLNDICFWIITIDIFFLPYLPFVAISGSVIFVSIWILCNMLGKDRGVLKDKEKLFFLVMFFLMIISTICNLFYIGDVHFETSFGTACKRLMQYGLSFGVYFFYKDYYKNKTVKINKIIFAFVIYATLFAIIYRSFPNQYAIYKYYLTPSDNHTMRYLSNMVLYRFNYLWVDPNNVAYSVVGIITWYLFNAEDKPISKVVLFVLSTFIVFCTQSIGGLITLISCSLFYALYSLFKSFHEKIKVKTIIWGIILFIGIISIYKFSTTSDYIEKNYINNFRLRIDNYSEMTIGGRGIDVIKTLRYLNPILLVVGTGNEGFSYEIGHFYWIGMYGFFSYLIFMWIVFRKKKYQSFREYIWIIPFFVGFTLNIAIGEFKWLSILFFLLTYSRENSIDMYKKMCKGE